MDDETDAIIAANQAFYLAFVERDVETMAGLWARREDVCCIHPGWEAIGEYSAVIESWRTIFNNPEIPVIRCRNESVALFGDSAVVVCYEVLDEDILIATNIFVREDDEWKIVHHHAGPITVAPDEDTVEEAPASYRLH